MPYNHKSKSHNARAWGKPKLREITNLDELDGDPNPDAPPVDDRSWQEKGQGYISNAAQGFLGPLGDHLLAAGGTIGDELGLMDPASKRGIVDDYQQRLKQVKDKHERYRQLEDDWSVGNLLSGAAGFAGSFPIWSKVGGMVGKATGALWEPVTGAGRVAKGALDLGLTSAAVNAPGHAADAAASVAGGEVPNLEDVVTGRKPMPAPPPTWGRAATTAAAETGMDALTGAALGPLGAGAARGLQRIGQLARNPGNRAARAIAERMLTSGKTAEALGQDFEAAAKGGKPVGLVDIAPEDVRSVGTASGRMPGGKDLAVPTLTERQKAQSQRIGQDIADTIGTKESFFKNIDELNRARAEEARPLYEAAFSKGVLKSPKIVEIVNRPSGKTALNAGLKIAQDEGIPLEELVIRDAAGNITGYTTKALHYAKMGMDDMIEAAKRSGDNSAARAYTILKNDLLKEMDRLNPEYAQARQVYAGHSAHSNALEAGRMASKQNLHPDQIEAELANMSEAEREMYRRGFMQHQLEIVENTPGAANAANKLVGKASQQARLKRILGPHYEEFMQRMDAESKMNRTYYDVTKGSPTAERLAEQQELDASLQLMEPTWAGAISDAFKQGSIGPILHKFGADGITNLLQGLNRESRAEIVRMMYSNDPAEVRAALKLISKEMERAARFKQVQEGIAFNSATKSRQANEQLAGPPATQGMGRPVDLGDY